MNIEVTCRDQIPMEHRNKLTIISELSCTLMETVNQFCSSWFQYNIFHMTVSSKKRGCILSIWTKRLPFPIEVSPFWKRLTQKRDFDEEKFPAMKGAYIYYLGPCTESWINDYLDPTCKCNKAKTTASLSWIACDYWLQAHIYFVYAECQPTQRHPVAFHCISMALHSLLVIFANFLTKDALHSKHLKKLSSPSNVMFNCWKNIVNTSQCLFHFLNSFAKLRCARKWEFFQYHNAQSCRPQCIADMFKHC